MKTLKTSIVIPAFNESTAIESVLKDAVERFKDDEYEIIVINDGSTDETAAIANRFPVRVVSHKRNRGYGAALKTGIRLAKGDIVVFMDSDAQHDPDNIKKLVSKLVEEDHDMVIGVREGGLQSTVLRTPGKILIRKLAESLVKDSIPDINSGMRAIQRAGALRFLPLCPDGFSLTTTLTLSYMCEGLSIGYVPIRINKRAGTSTVAWTDGLRAIFNIVSLIVLFMPKRVFLPISVIFLALGGSFGLYGVVETGKLPNTSIMLTTGGIIIFCFGFLAEQIVLLRRLLVDFRGHSAVANKTSFTQHQAREADRALDEARTDNHSDRG